MLSLMKINNSEIVINGNICDICIKIRKMLCETLLDVVVATV